MTFSSNYPFFTVARDDLQLKLNFRQNMVPLRETDDSGSRPQIRRAQQAGRRTGKGDEVMDSENRKGAVASTDSAQENEAKAIVDASGKDRNLIRQQRRVLEKGNRTLRKIRGEYYEVDVSPWNVWDPVAQAPKLGIHLCEVCKVAAFRTVIDRVALCRRCERTLGRKVA